VFGSSLDSTWSHRAFAESLGLGESVVLLSDAAREAAAAFGVLVEGPPAKARRSMFLIRGDTVVASWPLETPQPDIDAVVAAASGSSS
jgi:peroxiredoxin